MVITSRPNSFPATLKQLKKVLGIVAHWKMEYFWTHACIICLLLTLASKIKPGETVTLRKERSKDDFVQVFVPPYVQEGDTALLKCLYDVDIDKLYSMKWYKGATEFFRFTPKESPPIKTFPAFGGHVDLHLSNISDVALVRINLSMTDKYTCEVTKDSPDYTTSMKAGRMTVVALPRHKPVIMSPTRFASVGDTFTVNCTSLDSKPVANITWMLNGLPVSPHYLTLPITSQENEGSRETITLGLNFTVRQQDFVRSRMTLLCKATIEPDLYVSSAEIVIMKQEHHSKPFSVVDNYSSLPTGKTAGRSSESSHITSSGSFVNGSAVVVILLAQLLFLFRYQSLQVTSRNMLAT